MKSSENILKPRATKIVLFYLWKRFGNTGVSWCASTK